MKQLMLLFFSFLFIYGNAQVNNRIERSISVEEFKNIEHLGIFYVDSLECSCQINAYILTLAPANGHPIEFFIRYPAIEETTKQFIQFAKPGSVYYYRSVKAECRQLSDKKDVEIPIIKIRTRQVTHYLPDLLINVKE